MPSSSISKMFIKEALKTESPITPELINRLTEERTIRLLHASMGLMTEGAELLDALKKFIFYGKDLDLVNLKEEGGDSQWYFALFLDELGNSYEEIWAMVIKKLQMRYKDKGKFSNKEAITRNLDNERKILENAGFDELMSDISKNIKIEIIDAPVTHWLADTFTLEALCKNKKDEEMLTLEEKYLTCRNCIALHYNGSD